MVHCFNNPKILFLITNLSNYNDFWGILWIVQLFTLICPHSSHQISSTIFPNILPLHFQAEDDRLCTSKECFFFQCLNDDGSVSYFVSLVLRAVPRFGWLWMWGMCMHWLGDLQATGNERLAQMAGKWAGSLEPPYRIAPRFLHWSTLLSVCLNHTVYALPLVL